MRHPAICKLRFFCRRIVCIALSVASEDRAASITGQSLEFPFKSDRNKFIEALRKLKIGSGRSSHLWQLEFLG
jgi:hypothetical protein